MWTRRRFVGGLVAALAALPLVRAFWPRRPREAQGQKIWIGHRW